MLIRRDSSFVRSLVKWIGIVLLSISALWLLGWLQGNDPDCTLETSVMAQIRMCDAQELANATAQPLHHLLGILALFAVGLVCMWLAKPVPPAAPEPD